MTVNTTKITSGPYEGNDVADTFSYTFRISEKSELRVLVTDLEGVQTVLTVDTDYTVAGVGNDSGGTVTLTAGPLAAGYEIFFRSDYKQTQLTAFSSQGAFFPELHEDAVDKLTFLIQQLSYSISRSVRVDEDFPDDELNLVLPSPVAGFSLGWSDDAKSLVNIDIVTSLSEAAESAAEAAESAAEALASENKAEKWAEEDEDIPVEPSMFSAKHYSIKASNAAASVPVALTGSLPFVKSNSAADNILLYEATPGNFELPFFKSNGVQDNIAIIGI